jgi:hypothetical protein
MATGGREGFRDRFLLGFFLGGRYFGLSPAEIGEVGGEGGDSSSSENILVDRVNDGLDEGGRGLKYDLIDERFTFLDSGDLESG